VGGGRDERGGERRGEEGRGVRVGMGAKSKSGRILSNFRLANMTARICILVARTIK